MTWWALVVDCTLACRVLNDNVVVDISCLKHKFRRLESAFWCFELFCGTMWNLWVLFRISSISARFRSSDH